MDIYQIIDYLIYCICSGNICFLKMSSFTCHSISILHQVVQLSPHQHEMCSRLYEITLRFTVSNYFLMFFNDYVIINENLQDSRESLSQSQQLSEDVARFRQCLREEICLTAMADSSFRDLIWMVSKKYASPL